MNNEMIKLFKASYFKDIDFIFDRELRCMLIPDLTTNILFNVKKQIMWSLM